MLLLYQHYQTTELKSKSLYLEEQYIDFSAFQ